MLRKLAEMDVSVCAMAAFAFSLPSFTARSPSLCFICTLDLTSLSHTCVFLLTDVCVHCSPLLLHRLVYACGR